jgi:hypothetical protein
MRTRMALVILAVVACAKSEQPAADTAAMTAGPAAMTDADVAGTWTGEAKLAGTDSVFLHWTQICGGGTCKGFAQEAPDTVASTYTIEADSAHGVSAAYADPTMGGTRVVDHYVVRASGGSLTGTGWIVLADKPDSVLARYSFTGTRK